MKTTETSPLLPKGPASDTSHSSRSQNNSYSKREPQSPTLRRRASKTNTNRGNGGNGGMRTSQKQPPSKQQHDNDNDDESSNSDFEGEEDEYTDDASTRAAFGGASLHSHHNRNRRAQHQLQQARPLSYASDSATAAPLTALGMAARKPRWSVFRRSKAVASPPGTMLDAKDVVPRKKTRRNRFRVLKDAEDATAAAAAEAAAASDLQRRAGPPASETMARVAAYCTCEQISVFKLLKWLDKAVKDPRLHLAGWKHKMYMGVVHASFDPQQDQQPAARTSASASRSRTNSDDGDDNDNDRIETALLLQRKDAFYFATGCCVFWGMSREEEASHIQSLVPFSTSRVAEIEAEDMEFTYGDTSRVRNDSILLSSSKVEEKLAISFAMSQSAKLDVFEERVEDRIRTTKHIPFNLATTGSIQYSQTDISKLIGQLFMELADVNLHSDILDEPDFLWEDDEYEPLYKKMLKYLDVNNRVKILNKRLDILRELVEVLNQELTQRHGTKLEWIIIWLLVVGVVISIGWNMIIKDLLGFFNRK